MQRPAGAPRTSRRAGGPATSTSAGKTPRRGTTGPCRSRRRSGRWRARMNSRPDSNSIARTAWMRTTTRAASTSGTINGAPNQAIIWPGGSETSDTGRNGAYVSDRWQVASRLTLLPGVRMDFGDGSIPGHKGIFSTTAVSPRIGAAFDVGADHRTVLRAHVGRYVDPVFAQRSRGRRLLELAALCHGSGGGARTSSSSCSGAGGGRGAMWSIRTSATRASTR